MNLIIIFITIIVCFIILLAVILMNFRDIIKDNENVIYTIGVGLEDTQKKFYNKIESLESEIKNLENKIDLLNNKWEF